MASMSEDEHKKRHLELHKYLDELFADFITHGQGGTRNTVLDLITWSHKQTENLDHED